LVIAAHSSALQVSVLTRDQQPLKPSKFIHACHLTVLSKMD